MTTTHGTGSAYADTAMRAFPLDFIRANRRPPPLPFTGLPSLVPPPVDRVARAQFVASLRADAWMDTVESMILDTIRSAAS